MKKLQNLTIFVISMRIQKWGGPNITLCLWKGCQFQRRLGTCVVSYPFLTLQKQMARMSTTCTALNHINFFKAYQLKSFKNWLSQ